MARPREFDSDPLSPEQTFAMLRSESERWGRVVRAANIKGN